MRTMKKLLIMGIVVFALLAGTVAVFAASQYATPAEAIAGLTGRNVQSIIEERAETGKTCGTIAREAGVLERFREEMLEMRKDKLAARVEAGTLTQAQADAITAKIEARQATCDGSGSGCGLQGAGFGNCTGFGRDSGQGQGQKYGQGNGNRGQGRVQDGQSNHHGQGGHGQHTCLRDGSCVNR